MPVHPELVLTQSEHLEQTYTEQTPADQIWSASLGKFYTLFKELEIITIITSAYLIHSSKFQLCLWLTNLLFVFNDNNIMMNF